MWYLVLSHSLPERNRTRKKFYEDHRRWLDEQHRAGRLLFSGPTTDGKYGVSSCSQATSKNPGKLPDRIHIISGEFEKWRSSNGARIALSG